MEAKASTQINGLEAVQTPGTIPLPNKALRVRFSEKERLRITEYLDYRFSHKCVACGTSEKLEIHHRNGLSDNRLESLAWLCKSCNLSARILTPSAGLGVCMPDGGDSEDSMERNARTEPAWVEFVTNQLELAGDMRRSLLTGMSAFQINISVATVNRHWRKYDNPLGPFESYRPNQGTSVLGRLRRVPRKCQTQLRF